MFLLFLKHISLGNKKYVLLPYNLFITIEEKTLGEKEPPVPVKI